MIREGITPAQIEEEMQRLLSEYGREVEVLKDLAVEEAKKKIEFEVAYAKAYLLAKTERREDGKLPTDKEAESKAVLETATLQAEYEAQKSLRRAAEEKINLIKLQIEVLRSIYSFLKSEFERTPT